MAGLVGPPVYPQGPVEKLWIKSSIVVFHIHNRMCNPAHPA
jgi:hypothetical protein